MENSWEQATLLVYFFIWQKKKKKRLGSWIFGAIYFFYEHLWTRTTMNCWKKDGCCLWNWENIFFPNLKQNRQYAVSGEVPFPLLHQKAGSDILRFSFFFFPLLFQSLHNLWVIVSLNPVLQIYAKECFPSHMFPVCVCLCVRMFMCKEICKINPLLK